MNKASIVLIFLLILSCNSNSEQNKSIKLEKVEYSSNKDVINIHIVDGKDEVSLFNDNNTSTIKYKNSKVELKEFINDLNLYNIYKSEINNYGNLLILEYGMIGASGHSANIVFTSLFRLKENSIEEIISYNSFMKGPELIYLKEGSLFLDIYKYEVDSEKKQDFYCKTTFEIKRNDKLSKLKGSQCYSFSDNGQFIKNNTHNCNCKTIDVPKVIITNH